MRRLKLSHLWNNSSSAKLARPSDARQTGSNNRKAAIFGCGSEVARLTIQLSAGSSRQSSNRSARDHDQPGRHGRSLLPRYRRFPRFPCGRFRSASADQIGEAASVYRRFEQPKRPAQQPELASTALNAGSMTRMKAAAHSASVPVAPCISARKNSSRISVALDQRGRRSTAPQRCRHCRPRISALRVFQRHQARRSGTAADVCGS